MRMASFLGAGESFSGLTDTSPPHGEQQVLGPTTRLQTNQWQTNSQQGNNQDYEQVYKNEFNNKSSGKREVFRFRADWLISSVAWSNDKSEPYKLALGSYVEDYKNHIQIVQLAKDANQEEIAHVTKFEHPYPATKVLWIPKPDHNPSNQLPELIATTADYLRLWRVNNCDSTSSASGFQEPKSSINVKLESLLNCNQSSKLCAPLTSFDWNDVDPRLIVTASVDTTCAIWNLETSTVIGATGRVSGNLRTQVLAHDNHVYDVSFSPSASGRDVFVSSSGDGSVRLFDLRRLSTSTVLYEIESNTPSARRNLVRLSCSKRDANLVSTFASNSNEILIIDVRTPGKLLNCLKNHSDNLNAMSWAPHSAHHLCSGADDCQALIWDLSKLPDKIEEPLLGYRATGKINAMSWSSSQPDWIAIGFQNYLELLRV